MILSQRDTFSHVLLESDPVDLDGHAWFLRAAWMALSGRRPHGEKRRDPSSDQLKGWRQRNLTPQCTLISAHTPDDSDVDASCAAALTELMFVDNMGVTVSHCARCMALRLDAHPRQGLTHDTIQEKHHPN